MRKNLLLGLILFLSLANASFACCCQHGFTATNGQKACQNVFSFLAIDFSFLSPRATAADVHVNGFKHGFRRCCNPCNSDCCPESQCCPCAPECCPCQPQCCPPQCSPNCQPKCSPYTPPFNRKSMIIDEVNKEIPVNNIQLNTQEENKCEIPVCNSQMTTVADDKEIPVCNKQTENKPCTKPVCPQGQKSMFRIDLFRTFKFQIL